MRSVFTVATFRRAGLRVASALLVALVLLSVVPAAEAVISATDCNAGLDTLGLSIAGGGDFDGDGIPDFAYGAPCSFIRGIERAGRVWIRSGRNGRILRRVRGRQLDLLFGATLAWVGDLNGDGKDELAIGTPYFDTLDPSLPDKTLNDVGQVRVISDARRGPLLRIVGQKDNALFGASIVAISDLNGDGRRDLVIAALNEKDPFDADRRKGALHFVSGATGEIFETFFGRKVGQKPGLTLQNLGRVDGDATDDLLVTSAKNPIGQVLNAGFAEILSSSDLEPPLLEVGGAKNDELGQSSDTLGGTDIFILGSPGTRLADDLPDGGLAIAMRTNGTRVFTVSSIEQQKNARFGQGVAALGDVNGDGIEDFAASAPFFDDLLSFEEGFATDIGRIEVLSGLNGSVLYSLEGDLVNMRLGRTLASGIDLNGDGTLDLISGNPGDSPAGRRGAGTVNVYNGANGNLIRSFKGRRGLETRVFVFGKPGGTPTVRGFDSDGDLRELDAEVFAGVNTGDLSVAVLDEAQIPPIPGTMRVALGTGRGSTVPRVNVVRAGRQEAVLNNFLAFQGINVGVNVAAGDLNTDGLDELIAAQAASTTGDVDANVFRQLAGDPSGILGFVFDRTIRLFNAADFIGPTRIGADGANVAIGGLTGAAGREIAAAPVLGTPVVRVFTQSGVLSNEFLAYDTISFSGVNIAIGDLDGNGSNEIVTAPNRGVALIRAFSPQGAPFVGPGDIEPVSFLALPETHTNGARVAIADVDFDGEGEILVVPGPGLADRVLAFETDGTPVEGIDAYQPFDGTVTDGTQIAGTDRFVRN